MRRCRYIFLEGIRNLEAICGNEQLGLMNSLKFFCFYVFLCIVAKKNKEKDAMEKMFFINGRAEFKKENIIDNKMTRIHLRKFTNNINELKNKFSLVSSFSKIERITIILEAIITVPSRIDYLGRWLEFLFLSKMFEKKQMREVCSFGHYDEFSYWLTELCDNFKVYYTMYQHGVVMGDLDIPNKVYADEVHVYNKYSKKIFEEKIIKNNTCCYVIGGLNCSVEFNVIPKDDNKYYIGVIDQMDDSWIKKIVNSIKKVRGCVPVVMIHPLRKKSFNDDNDVIITLKKIKNLDALVTSHSTLVYDYLACGYNKPIISTNLYALDTIFKEYKLHYSNEDCVDDSLIDILALEEGDDNVTSK